MTLRDYWQGLKAPEKQALAEACGTTVAYLTQVFHGHRNAGPKLAQRLSANSSLALSVIRPDVWGCISS